MFTVIEKPKHIEEFNSSVIDYYMDKHDFLKADRSKVNNFISQENNMRCGGHKFVGGYLTRTDLVLVTAYGTEEKYNRLFFGIQENFK